MVQLTPKQEKFALGLVSGLSQRQAWIEAGYASEGKSDNYIDKEACLLAKNSKVSVRYHQLMREHKKKSLWTRQMAIDKLKWLVDEAEEHIREDGFRHTNSSAYINAIKELNALEGAYPAAKQAIDVSVNNPYDDLTADELRALINIADD